MSSFPCSGGWAHALDLNAEVTVEAGDFKVRIVFVYCPFCSCMNPPELQIFEEFRVGITLRLLLRVALSILLLRARAAQHDTHHFQLTSRLMPLLFV